MDQENLNIEQKIKKMVICRLNKMPTLKAAAESLGIADNTLRKYQWRYNIQYNEELDRYVFRKDSSGGVKTSS